MKSSCKGRGRPGGKGGGKGGWQEEAGQGACSIGGHARSAGNSWGRVWGREREGVQGQGQEGFNHGDNWGGHT